MNEPKLIRVTRTDSIPLGTYITEEGFFHDEPVVTTTGIFEYKMPDGNIRKELRLPEHVFEAESLASYSGKPLIITHNAGEVTKENVMNEIVGTILGEGYQDGDDVRCKIVIHDTDRVKKIPYRELSLGYSLDCIEQPGEWRGQHYDAVQTNIRINHLAIVGNARAGGQAHLNLDGKPDKACDTTNLKGGTKMDLQKDKTPELTPEELEQAIADFKAKKAEENSQEVEEKMESDGEASDIQGSTPEDILEAVKKRREEREKETYPDDVAEIVNKQNEDLDMLLAVIEKLLAEEKFDSKEPEKTEEEAKPVLNEDSADEIFRQRLSICRIGDKLNMDGLENKSIIDGKKAIINKVLPSMRLDGKSVAYIDAAFDLAVGEANKPKDIGFQKEQMVRKDGKQEQQGNVSMALAARQKMIEGGK